MGGMHGEGGVHGEAGACMAKGGMHGLGSCVAKGEAWVAGGHAWQGGMCGGGHAWQGGMCGGGHAWQERRQLQRTVGILLECILVECIYTLFMLNQIAKLEHIRNLFVGI